MQNTCCLNPYPNQIEQINQRPIIVHKHCLIQKNTFEKYPPSLHQLQTLFQNLKLGCDTFETFHAVLQKALIAELKLSAWAKHHSETVVDYGWPEEGRESGRDHLLYTCEIIRWTIFGN